MDSLSDERGRPAALPAVLPAVLPADLVLVGGGTASQGQGQDGWGMRYVAESPSGRVTVRLLDRSWSDDPQVRDGLLGVMRASRRTAGLACVARVLDVGWDEQSAYIVTEYVEGATLRETVARRGPLAGPALLRATREAAYALRALHGLGAIHGCPSPDTMVLGPDGVRLVDVGLVPIVTRSLSNSRDTAQFLAPEVCLGGSPGAPADVFGWAASTYFAATGLVPFESVDVADVVDRARAIAAGPPDLAGLPADLAPLVAAGLAAHPAARPSAEEIWRALGGDRATRAERSAPSPQQRQPAADALPLPLPPEQPQLPEPLGALPPPPGGWQAPRRGEGRSGRGRVRRRGALLIGLAVIAAGGLVATLMLHGGKPQPVASEPQCPDAGNTSAGTLQSLAFVAGEGCYGFTDSGSGFGRDAKALAAQQALFASNRPLAPGDLTVIWMGALTCPAYRADGACADGRSFDSQTQELLGLRLSRSRKDVGGAMHAVIANTGPSSVHAEAVARLIAARRSSLGRVVVIGGDESRSTTKRAIRSLLDAGIPVISPNLTADAEAPGQSFVPVAGYLQMSPPNLSWAASAVSFIGRHTPAGQQRKVFVYHVATAGDEYTDSFARDVQLAAHGNPVTSASDAPILSGPEQIPVSVCRTSGGTGDALVFADRWTTFRPFAQRLTELCGSSGPSLVVGTANLDRFMSNDQLRSEVDAPWPLAYFRVGRQCSDLELAAGGSASAAELLATVRSSLGSCRSEDPATRVQIGDRIPMIWDAVGVAADVVPPASKSAGSGLVEDRDVNTSAGTLSVRGGTVVSRAWAPTPICVRSVDLSRGAARGTALCEAAFSG